VEAQPARTTRGRGSTPRREPVVHPPPLAVRRRRVREAAREGGGAQPPPTERGAARAHLGRQRRDGAERAARPAAREPGGAQADGGAVPLAQHMTQVVDLALQAAAQVPVPPRLDHELPPPQRRAAPCAVPALGAHLHGERAHERHLARAEPG